MIYMYGIREASVHITTLRYLEADSDEAALDELQSKLILSWTDHHQHMYRRYSYVYVTIHGKQVASRNVRMWRLDKQAKPQNVSFATRIIDERIVLTK
jgi:hypothetical protein